MRFDDSLATVLAADSATANGASAAWRQLVDLTGRRRVADVDVAVAHLRNLRGRVPAAVRGASGRALALAAPPAALVALFADDELATAAPVLRTATLDASDWLALLPTLSPAARAVLRHRRDLPAAVVRGLESFGATDFVLDHDVATEPVIAPIPVDQVEVVRTPFVEPPPTLAPATPPAPKPIEATAGPGFEIAALVARIDAFQRDRPEPMRAMPPPLADRFRFHTDGAGVICWIEGVARGPLIGVALTTMVQQGLATVDRDAVAATRERRAFRGCALHVAGDSSAAGNWHIAGEPRFDRGTGRFAGIAGTGRRVAVLPPTTSASDMLRQLVHELRTPANAIAGFAELIGSELLGPVPPVYRDRAALIQQQGGALTEAIADLDTAARIEGDALETRSGAFDLAPLVVGAVADLQSVAQARYVLLTLEPPSPAWVRADDRAARRLVERLLVTAVAAAMPGEQMQVQLVAKTRSVRLHLTRPRALPAADDRLLTIDASERGDDLLPLGVGFTLRLVRSLATALGGSLTITPDRLTLRLPTVVTAEMEQAAAQ